MTENLYQKVLDMFLADGMSKSEISRALCIPRTTVRRWINKEKRNSPSNAIDRASIDNTEILLLKDKIKKLETDIRIKNKETVNEHYIREHIFQINSESRASTPPDWVVNPNPNDSDETVPTIFLSDWHWGEVVNPAQIGGVNEYNMDIAHERTKKLVSTTIKLLDMAHRKYPGIVVAMGGDMFSGDAHLELTATNENSIMPVFLDLYEKMIWILRTFADKYGKVFVPVVSGNHSRTTPKIMHKNRNFTNYDWLLGCLLEKYFENDGRIKFLIPDGPDAYFKIYNTKYLLTHGDQFRGGDGMIGSLGVIVRGDQKKRGRNAQIGKPYDCMIIGHFHQLIQMQRVICNGSLKGLDEYAHNGNFGYEPPRQALWLTHPKYGIVMSMAVNVDKHQNFDSEQSSWVSWK